MFIRRSRGCLEFYSNVDVGMSHALSELLGKARIKSEHHMGVGCVLMNGLKATRGKGFEKVYRARSRQ
jgi:hypothetical protein